MTGAPEVSAREAEVLAALAGGRSNAQIARQLHISVRTVESHVSSLLRKYGVSDRHELAGLAELTQESREFTTLAGPGTTFVGREHEQTELLAALETNRLVSLLGPGGVGKTRLALRVAVEAAGNYPYGGAVVDLVPVRPGFVVAAVAEALGVREQPPHTLLDALFARLQRGRTLLVLDNCEHLVLDVGDLVARILAQAPQTAVLVTSRERIGVTGERSVQLAPLALGSEAEQLFRDRVAPEFAADDEVAAQLCAGLDGVPLAIELAAARADSLGPDGLLAALDDRLRLAAGGRGPNERHHSLAQVIGWSYDLLDDAERALFRRLGVFVGGFDLSAAEAISPASSRGEVSDLLGRLTDKSLLHRTQLAGTSRWRMLETVRAYALDELKGRGEYDAVAVLHLAWADSTAARLEERLEHHEDWQSEFDQVTADLRAAVSRSDTDVRRLARRLAHLTFARKRFVEAREHYLTAAAHASDATQLYDDLRDAADAALAVSDGAHAYQLMMRSAAENNHQDALAYAVTILNRYEAMPPPPDHGASLLPKDVDTVPVLIARAWASRQEVGPAEAALDAARKAGDPLDLMNALDAYGVAVASAGRLNDARRSAEERLELAATLPDHEPRAVAEITDAFHVASTTAVSVGDLPEAVRLARLTDDPVHGHPYITAPRKIRAFALSGLFDEAVQAADVMWNGWTTAGRPPRSWMASAASCAALTHGLLGTGQDAVWQGRALQIAQVSTAADSPGLMASAAFVDARLALHRLDSGQLSATLARSVEQAFEEFPEPWWAPYAWASGAELAAALRYPDAEQYLQRAVSENAWSDAVLLRARGRLTGERAPLEQAAEQFERIGAQFEHADTLRLLSHR
ncbi:LuxR C-terminal-related transcriptional regulator [Kribbella sp. NPDC050820]|uniref:ATP-binding protein n=1 Tax=Kribbella sp. NPDC050820 TaxID=3155408 RepID=UPI0033D4CFBB